MSRDNCQYIDKYNRYNMTLYQVDHTLSYTVHSKPVGFAVIINISKAFGHRELVGADKDVRNMRELWTTLGFTVEVKENICAQVRSMAHRHLW